MQKVITVFIQVNEHAHSHMVKDAYNIHGKYVYSTLALGKERETVKEETALRKEKEAVCCYRCTCISCICISVY